MAMENNNNQTQATTLIIAKHKLCNM